MAADLTANTAAAASAGVASLTVALLGVEPQALFYAFCGSGLGLSWAASAGRFRALAVFAFTTLGAAMFGTWAAQEMWAGAVVARDGMSFLLGVVAHPLIAAVIGQLEPVARGLADKLGAKR